MARTATLTTAAASSHRRGTVDCVASILYDESSSRSEILVPCADIERILPPRTFVLPSKSFLGSHGKRRRVPVPASGHTKLGTKGIPKETQCRLLSEMAGCVITPRPPTGATKLASPDDYCRGGIESTGQSLAALARLASRRGVNAVTAANGGQGYCRAVLTGGRCCRHSTEECVSHQGKCTAEHRLTAVLVEMQRLKVTVLIRSYPQIAHVPLISRTFSTHLPLALHSPSTHVLPTS